MRNYCLSKVSFLKAIYYCTCECSFISFLYWIPLEQAFHSVHLENGDGEVCVGEIGRMPESDCRDQVWQQNIVWKRKGGTARKRWLENLKWNAIFVTDRKKKERKREP